MKNIIFLSPFRLITLLSIVFMVSSCGSLDRLANIGKAPDLAPVEAAQVVPQHNRPDQQALQYPRSYRAPLHNPQNSSLWKTGSKHFFKDQRARFIGDILTVNITIDDEAKINNATSRSRSSGDKANLNKFGGLETLLPSVTTPADLIDLGSTTSNTGSGSVDRQEKINLTVAAVVTQLLPNGNMFIQGRQEVRVNFEVRELTVMGVIRPEDINANNIIQHTQIAEARISYGGRGQITDVQQPRYGQQLFDILFPF